LFKIEEFSQNKHSHIHDIEVYAICEHYFLTILKSLGERAFSDKLLGKACRIIGGENVLLNARMMDALITQLEEILTEFPDTLARHHQSPEGHHKQNSTLTSRQELNEMFLCILSGLKKVTSSNLEMDSDGVLQILAPELTCFMSENMLQSHLHTKGSVELILSPREYQKNAICKYTKDAQR